MLLNSILESEADIMANIESQRQLDLQDFLSDDDNLEKQWKQQLSYINQRKRTNVDLDTILWQLQIMKKIADRLPSFPLISIPDSLSYIRMSYPNKTGAVLIIKAFSFSNFRCFVTRVNLYKDFYDGQIYFHECVDNLFCCDNIGTLVGRIKYFFKYNEA